LERLPDLYKKIVGKKTTRKNAHKVELMESGHQHLQTL